MDKQLILTAAEERLAGLIWREAPLTSPELVTLAENELDWKKSTTYTVLKKLCDKGVFKNEHAMVSTILEQETFIKQQSYRYVDDAFGGSLPRFIATVIGGRKISPEQAEELKRLIEQHEEADSDG
ncbi:MAG: BlaI/MecI/CopY family transcriptional regulator [Oscillospiraceae bacterium]|nr:BlaI/MecI/CopY family transcriptional regulator [Oscillospiraceae bacterium]